MCGRFTLAVNPEQIRSSFPWLNVPDQLQPRYNVAPTQPIAVVPNDGADRLDFFVWGLVPSWAKDPAIGNKLINARAETLQEKPAFRSAFRRRRCLVLADGFYEWQAVPGRKGKIPMYVQLSSGKPFAFAGLWENWHGPDGSQILSATIITTAPNQLMQAIHNRMPVILPEEAYRQWLESEEADPQQLQELLVPYPAEAMRAFPVSTRVNSPDNESPECVQPLAD